MKRLGAGLFLALLVLAGCGEESVVTPPPLPPPPPPGPPTPPPGPDPDAIPVGFGGVLPAPGAALTLHPGTEFVIPVMADRTSPSTKCVPPGLAFRSRSSPMRRPTSWRSPGWCRCRVGAILRS